MLHLSAYITAYLILLAALLGLAMGSFLGCLSSRLVHGGSVLKGRSRCESCGHVLGARDLVPVLSWLFSKGRCRYCGVKLSPAYPIQELVCGLIYVSLLLRYDVNLEALMFVILLSLLFAASLVDLEIQELPDGFLLAGALAWFPLAYIQGGFTQIFQGLLGAALLFVPMLLVVLLFDRLSGKESMGGGDLKLIALLGLYFGWKLGWLLIIVSCIFGLILAALLGRIKSRTAIPFGPALSAAAWFTALFGERLLALYLGLF